VNSLKISKSRVWVFTARSELYKLLFLVLYVTFLCGYEISWEPMNGFVPNSQGRGVWSLAWTNLNVKVKVHGHQGQKTLGFSADILGTAERICAKLTWKMCLIPRSELRRV